MYYSTSSTQTDVIRAPDIYGAQFDEFWTHVSYMLYEREEFGKTLELFG